MGPQCLRKAQSMAQPASRGHLACSSKGRILTKTCKLASSSQSCGISTDLPLMLGVCSARKAT